MAPTKLKRAVWSFSQAGIRLFFVLALLVLAYASMWTGGYVMAASAYVLFAVGIGVLAANKIRHAWSQSKYKFGEASL